MKIAKMFSNNMVLQRDMPIKIWGSGCEGENISKIADCFDYKLAYEFNREDLPFFIVQLPFYDDTSAEDTFVWGSLREAQFNVCRRMENAYLVVAIDDGEKENIHPKEK